MRTRRRALSIGLAVVAAAGFGAYALRSPAPQTPVASADGAGLLATLVALSDEGFARPPDGWRLSLPADHMAHVDMRTEAWTLAAQLRDADGAPVGVQVTLLRLGVAPPGTGETEDPWALRHLFRAHVTLSDGAARRAFGEERFSRGALGVAGHDPAEGAVWLDDWTLRFGQGPDGDRLSLRATVEGRIVALDFAPDKPALAADAAGAPARGYALSRLKARGEIGRPGALRPVEGLGWMDHLWGELPTPGGPVAWDRMQLQMDDGTDLSLTVTRRSDGGGTPTVDGVAVGADGAATALSGLTAAPVRRWRDGRGGSWPVAWRVGGDGLDLTVTAAFDDQAHRFAAPLWTGLATAEGRMNGARVSGAGTMVLTGYGAP